MHAISRNQEASIKLLMRDFPCVAILGARQVGKSTLLKKLAPEAAFFDLESRSDYERLSGDPELVFREQESRPIVFDEAQLAPELFSALRIEIDRQLRVLDEFVASTTAHTACW